MGVSGPISLNADCTQSCLDQLFEGAGEEDGLVEVEDAAAEAEVVVGELGIFHK